MIEVNALSKHFGSFTAVDDISFTMQPGEVLGLLGPNGAGTTTAIGRIRWKRRMTRLVTCLLNRASVLGSGIARG